jgi:hypothetical protein
VVDLEGDADEEHYGREDAGEAGRGVADEGGEGAQPNPRAAGERGDDPDRDDQDAAVRGDARWSSRSDGRDCQALGLMFGVVRFDGTRGFSLPRPNATGRGGWRATVERGRSLELWSRGRARRARRAAGALRSGSRPTRRR